MKNAIKDKQAKKGQKNLVGLGFVTLIFLVLLKMFPEKYSAVIDVSLSYFKEMMLILPAVVLLMGLFMV